MGKKLGVWIAIREVAIGWPNNDLFVAPCSYCFWEITHLKV